MGLEGWQVVDRSNDYSDPSSASKFQVINLLHPPDEAEEEGSSLDSNHRDDPWMQTAVQIESNIREMATWIRRKQREYVKLDTPDEEASLIQSTVTSFTATTANEIESLHQCVAINLKSNSAQQQKQQHCAGIVQILMVELKENVAEPFGRLSKQRHRAAVQLWQTPLQCRLWTPTTTARRTTTMSKNEKETLELLGLDDESEQSLATTKMTDQRFQPVRASHRLHRDFLQSYERTKGPTNSKLLRPPSLFRSDTSDNEPKFEGTHQQQLHAHDTKTVQSKNKNKHDQLLSVADDDYYASHENSNDAAALQQEAIQLQAKTHSDLDSVQKMEQTMVDITALLSQFANLVTEQQEDVWEIHDATVSTKENLQKGQENLMDAAERTASSKHYMATAITAMGVLLLLLNWLRS